MLNVVYGPPGCGKTSHLLTEMGGLKAGGIDPHRIGFVAFTRAAAREALTRLGVRQSKTIRTLHSLAYEVCGVSREQVVDSIKLQEFADLVGYPITNTNSIDEGEQTVGDEMLEVCSLAEAMQMPLERVFEERRPDLDLDITTMFKDAYDQWKNACGFVDFNDMLKGMAEMNPDLGISHLFVDEGQDLSPLQWKVVRGLMAHASKVMVAGDDDQAIYTWAGADPHGMEALRGAYGGSSVVLGQSYRVPRCAHRLAEEVIQRVCQRVDKEYAPRKEEGLIQTFASIKYLDGMSGDTLVLYRNHSMRSDVEEWLIDNRVPYTMIGSVKSSLFDSRYANAIRAWMNLKDGKEISMNQLACMGKAARREFKQDVANKDFNLILSKHWLDIFEVPPAYIDYLMQVDLRAVPHVRVSTIHSAKGMEADNVVLMNGMGARTFEQMNDDEHRVWYVAVTRTRHNLTIIEGDNPYDLHMEAIHGIQVPA